MNTLKFEKFMSKNAELVDIRSAIDYRNSSIIGSRNSPFHVFCSELQILNKEKYIILICNNRSDSDCAAIKKYAELFGIKNLLFVEYREINKLMPTKDFNGKAVV